MRLAVLQHIATVSPARFYSRKCEVEFIMAGYENQRSMQRGDIDGSLESPEA
jgi:hypothetical protein